AGPLEPLAAWLGLDEPAFRRRFRGSALRRARRSGLLRNAALVLGNRRDPAAGPALRRALDDPDPVVRDAAAWALERAAPAAGHPPRPGGRARAPARPGRSRPRRSRRGGVGSRAGRPRVRPLALALVLLSSPIVLAADLPLPGPYQQALHALQTDPVAAGRGQAAVALGQGFTTVPRPGADPRIVGALGESVRLDPDPTVRALAAYALCLLGDARGAP